jgi:hypothetical protein
MALTLEQLETKRDALVLAISSGELSVRFESRQVQYRSIEEMQRALAFLEGQIEKLTGTAIGQRVSYVTVRR